MEKLFVLACLAALTGCTIVINPAKENPKRDERIATEMRNAGISEGKIYRLLRGEE